MKRKSRTTLPVARSSAHLKSGAPRSPVSTSTVPAADKRLER
jgi:hypothetical protein